MAEDFCGVYTRHSHGAQAGITSVPGTIETAAYEPVAGASEAQEPSGYRAAHDKDSPRAPPAPVAGW